MHGDSEPGNEAILQRYVAIMLNFLVYMIVEKILQRYDPLAIICDV